MGKDVADLVFAEQRFHRDADSPGGRDGEIGLGPLGVIRPQDGTTISAGEAKGNEPPRDGLDPPAEFTEREGPLSLGATGSKG